jgi:dCTP deaminase
VILSDRSIREALEQGRIAIDPLDLALLQPSSLDIRVDQRFRVFAGHRYPFIDPREAQPELTTQVVAENGQPFILHPGEFVLGSTLERVRLAADIVARLEGKSGLGRLGLLIHSTAGFVDPGFEGHLTLELSNVARLPIAIYPGMAIGQLSFYELSTAAEHPYGSAKVHSKYQGQSGPTPSRLHEDFSRRP